MAATCLWVAAPAPRSKPASSTRPTCSSPTLRTGPWCSRNGFPDYRYNDREIIRAFADYSAPTYDWLVDHGVIFIDTPIDNRGAGGTGNSAPREAHLAAMDWVQYQTGVAQPPERGPITSSGIGLVRPLEAEARKMGVRIMLNTRMTDLIREPGAGGRVIGVTCTARWQKHRHPRQARRHPRHRRLDQQRQLPPHLRPAD